MPKESKAMYSPWENAIGMLQTEIDPHFIGVFLAQLASTRYTSWQIGSLWGMSAYEVSSYRRALCHPSHELLPEVKHLAADFTLMEIRKEAI